MNDMTEPHSQQLIRLRWLITSELVRELLPYLDRPGLKYLIDQLGPGAERWALLPDDLEEQWLLLLWELADRAEALAELDDAVP
jgi:hypothetical protein